jgi:hypothetical protein
MYSLDFSVEFTNTISDWIQLWATNQLKRNYQSTMVIINKNNELLNQLVCTVSILDNFLRKWNHFFLLGFLDIMMGNRKSIDINEEGNHDTHGDTYIYLPFCLEFREMREVSQVTFFFCSFFYWFSLGI